MPHAFLRAAGASAALAALAFLIGCTSAHTPGAPMGPANASPQRLAVARLLTPAGQAAGQATLTEMPNGVEIAVSVQGLTPGPHGFHIHTNGVCAPGPDAATGQTVAFGAAGGHFDPGQARKHGHPGEPPNRAHAGELPNIPVGANGQGSLRYRNPHVTLSRQANSVLGRTLVVHERADDYVSDPAGNSGGRLLCGVIEAAQAAPRAGLWPAGGVTLAGR